MSTDMPNGLSAAREQVLDELRRADTKATTLLSLVGAALAGVVALAQQGMAGAGAVLLWTSLAPIFASVVLLLAVIRPRLNRHPTPGSWLHAARVGPATLLDTYSKHTPMLTADDVCNLARIARAKYRRITAAVVLLLAGLVTLMASLLATAVTA